MPVSVNTLSMYTAGVTKKPPVIWRFRAAMFFQLSFLSTSNKMTQARIKVIKQIPSEMYCITDNELVSTRTNDDTKVPMSRKIKMVLLVMSVMDVVIIVRF